MFVDFKKMSFLLVFLSTVDYRLLANIPGVPSITLTEAVAYLMAMLYVGRAAFDEGSVVEGIMDVCDRNRIVIFYFMWGAVSAVVGIMFGRSADTLEMYRSLFPSLLVYFFVMSFVRTEEDIEALCRAFLAGIAVNVGLGLLQLGFGGPRPVAVNEAFTQKLDYAGNFITNAPTGLFSHPNGLGLLLMPGLLLLVVLLRRKISLVLVLFSCAVFLVMAMTYAKGVLAWTVLAVAVMVLPCTSCRVRTGFGVLAVLGGIAAMVVYAIASVTHGGSSLGTILTRVYLWVAASDIIAGDIFIQIFGNGIPEMASRSWQLARFEYPNAHNGIINQALFYGLPAMFLYIAIFYSALWRVSSVTSDGIAGSAARFVYACLIAMFGEFFFEPANVNVTLQVHAFIVIALANVITELGTSRSPVPAAEVAS